MGLSLESGGLKLITIGKDRKLVEFDLSQSLFSEGLKLKDRVTIEQDALPTGIALLPQNTEEQFIIVGNDKNKIKLLNMTTKMCRKILLSPNVEESINSIHPIVHQPSVKPNETSSYFIFLCGKYLALTQVPLQGFQDSFLNKLASDVPIGKLSVTLDGFYCFSLAASDNNCLIQHSIDVNVIEEFRQGTNKYTAYIFLLKKSGIQYTNTQSETAQIVFWGGGKGMLLQG